MVAYVAERHVEGARTRQVALELGHRSQVGRELAHDALIRSRRVEVAPLVGVERRHDVGVVLHVVDPREAAGR